MVKMAMLKIKELWRLGAAETRVFTFKAYFL